MNGFFMRSASTLKMQKMMEFKAGGKMINVSKVDNWWECRQCRRQFEVGSESNGYTVGGKGYYCKECFRDGIIWAIAMAHKEKLEINDG